MRKKSKKTPFMTPKTSFLSRYCLDGWLILNLLALMIIGCFILYSAKQDWLLVERQGLRFAMATLLMIGIAQIPPNFLRPFAVWLYGIGIALVIMVLILGDVSKGGQRWLSIGFFRFQPAELLKIAVPLYLAQFLSMRELPPNRAVTFFAMGLIALPVLLVAKQPDLGTAILIGCTGFLTLFFAGISFRFFSGITNAGHIGVSHRLVLYARLSAATHFNAAKPRVRSARR